MNIRFCSEYIKLRALFNIVRIVQSNFDNTFLEFDRIKYFSDNLHMDTSQCLSFFYNIVFKK